VLALSGSTALALVLAAVIGAGTMSTESSPTPRSNARSTPPSSPAPTGSSCPPASRDRRGALLAPPLVALLGLEATLVLTGSSR
jgi:hypothetical protein